MVISCATVIENSVLAALVLKPKGIRAFLSEVIDFDAVMFRILSDLIPDQVRFKSNSIGFASGYMLYARKHSILF